MESTSNARVAFDGVSLRSTERTILLNFTNYGTIEYTLPEKPTSPRQKYRLTDKGRTELENLKSEKAE